MTFFGGYSQFIPSLEKKLFITFHGYQANGLPSQKAIFWRRLAKRLCRGSIMVGQFQEKYYGIKTDKIILGASGLKPSKTSKEKNKLIYLGRLEADNGILSYLEALKILREQGRQHQLDVYGTGKLQAKAEKYAKKHQLSVKFHGAVENAGQLLQKYPQALVSSYLSIIEALAANCQIISFANFQLKKDYLKMTPFSKWITIQSNAQDIAQAITNKIKNPKEAWTWAKKQTWKKISQNYLDLWQKK